MIHDFTYLKPGSLQEALSMLADHKDECKIICGGQSLLIMMRQGMLVTDYLIDIKGLNELNYITYDEKEGLKIGATTTHRAIEKSELVKQQCHVLVEIEKKVASIQIRNWGSIAGNLAHGDAQAGDLAPSLIALGAKVKLASLKGDRGMFLEEFYTGFFENAMNIDELMVEVQVPPAQPRSATAYTKFNLIGNDQGIVGVASTVVVEKNGTCKDARIVLGNSGVIPIRAKNAEQVLMDKKLNDELLIEAAQVAASEADPVPDIHASEEYRRHLIRVLTKRMVRQAWEEAIRIG
jgi:carbon-monoxide dehydrogenase medium subunit